jgi:hypothetical protein
MRAAVMIMLAGCGDALVTSDFRGDPVFTVEGRVTDIRYDFRSGEQLRASVFWSLASDTTVDPAQLSEQTSVAVRVTFPSAFKINLFDPPDESLLAQGRPYWAGQIMVYEDEDENARFSPGELRGGASYSALLYATRALNEGESPTGQSLDAGFTLVNLPLPCTTREGPPPIGGDDCGVPLGAACASDADCGTGVCLLSDGYITFPDGYCSLSDESGCVPANAQIDFFYIPPETPIDAEEVPGFYYLGCATNGDCREGYECFAYVNACLPKLPVFIDIYPEFDYAPLCEFEF